MAATWTIKNVEAYTEYDDHAQVIFRVHWCCTQSTTLDHTLYSADLTGGQGIEPAPPARFPFDSFTPYAEVTEAEVVGWVHAYMGAGIVADIEERCEKIMEERVAPTTLSGTPWVSPEP